MRKKINFILSLLCISVGMLFAQNQVTGIVMDETGEPIIGASILIKGTEQGTITNVDGNFMLNVPEGATLVFSYVGMKT